MELHPATIMDPIPAPMGTGEIRQPRMYHLVRQEGPTKDVTFEIEFLDPGVEVFSFTFG